MLALDVLTSGQFKAYKIPKFRYLICIIFPPFPSGETGGMGERGYF